jgi:hypothetical protein
VAATPLYADEHGFSPKGIFNRKERREHKEFLPQKRRKRRKTLNAEAAKKRGDSQRISSLRFSASFACSALKLFLPAAFFGTPGSSHFNVAGGR